MSTFGGAKIGAVRRQRRTRTRHEDSVLPAYAVTPAKKYYVWFSKKRQEISSIDLDFHLSRDRDYKKDFAILKEAFIKEGFEITDQHEKHFTYILELRSKNYPRRLKIEIKKQICVLEGNSSICDFNLRSKIARRYFQIHYLIEAYISAPCLNNNCFVH